MKKNERHHSEKFNKHLSAMLSGKSAPKKSLFERRPLSKELKALLELAQELRSSLKPPPIDQTYRAEAEIRLIEAMRAAPKKRLRPRRKRGLRRLQPSFALASLLLVIILLGTSVETVLAYHDISPGDFLYQAKRGYEQVRLLLTFDQMEEAELLAQFAEERVVETETLVVEGHEETVPTTIRAYEELVDQLLILSEQISALEGPGSPTHVSEQLAKNIRVLEQVQLKVSTRTPAQARAQQAIQKAIDHSLQNQQAIEQLEQDGNPNDPAPKKNPETRGKPKNGDPLDGSPAPSEEEPTGLPENANPGETP
jgi:hypothetical protein